jgi:uncharacterized protein YodC (DUF2158 family)
MDFKTGDVVKLKSGGPLMTVEKIGRTQFSDEDAVWCTWFETTGGKRVVQRETFASAMLEKEEKRTPGPITLTRS